MTPCRMPIVTRRKCIWTFGHKLDRLVIRLLGGLVRDDVSASDGVEHMATVGERAGLATAAGQAGTEAESSKERGRKRTGMEVPRVFSTEGVSPFDSSTGNSGRRRSRTNGGGSSSSRRIARSRGPGANWPRTSCRASTSTAMWPAATAARRRETRVLGPPVD